ncbi:hypothetical protein M426DRAFT_317372 [Hypoxylon sp. CI-4A]|nr:hypothetical protein M426DRAFT_317372 [Hypoxylon sp. CI-4A]
MAPVTELILLPLNPSLDPETITATLQTNTATLLSQPGCQRVRTSRTHEDANQLRIFADWDSVAAHQAFGANAAVSTPFRERVASIIDASVPRRKPYHVEIAPFPPTVLNGAGGGGKTPVAEVLHAYFASADASDAAFRARTLDTVTRFFDGMLAFARGMTGETAAGWTVEDNLEFKGERCRALVAVLGWTAVEAHVQARQTDEFAKVIPLMRGLEKLKGMEVCHVSNNTVEKDG